MYAGLPLKTENKMTHLFPVHEEHQGTRHLLCIRHCRQHWANEITIITITQLMARETAAAWANSTPTLPNSHWCLAVSRPRRRLSLNWLAWPIHRMPHAAQPNAGCAAQPRSRASRASSRKPYATS